MSRRQRIFFRFEQREGDRLSVGADANTERVVSPPARTSTRFAGDDLDGAKRGFAADQVLRPAALMYRGIDQLRTGVGFGEGQSSR